MLRPVRPSRSLWDHNCRAAMAIAVLLGAAISLPCFGQTRPTASAPAADPTASMSAAELRARVHELERENTLLKALLVTSRDEVRQLKTELNEARGTTGAATRTAPATPRVPLGYIEIPPRKLSGLGMIRPTETRIADRPPGAEQVRIMLPPSPDNAQPVAAEQKGAAEIVISAGSGAHGTVQLAVLALKTDGLYWTWAEGGASAMAEPLRHLDVALRSSMILVEGRGGLLARYQYKPDEIGVQPNSPAAKRLPAAQAELLAQLRLVPGTTGPGWNVTQDDANHLSFSKNDYTLSVVFDPAAATVAASWAREAGGEERRRIDDISQEIAGWKEDNRLLQARMNDATIRAAALQQIQINNQRIAELEAEKANLVAQAARNVQPPPGSGDIEAQLELPNGVVLYLVKFKH